MSLESWDPFYRLEKFRCQSILAIDKLIADLPNSMNFDEPIGFHPEVDLIETPDEYRLYLSIPGFVEDDILIDVEGRVLTIRGERRAPYDSGRRGACVQEWRYGFFERKFELASLIVVANLRAVYDSGVLTIVAKKSDELSTDTPKESDDNSGHHDKHEAPQ